MANHFRLYGRPLSADDTSATLSVTGDLETYTPGDAYESRLQINNSVGRCTVRVISSDLPAGAAVRVDNITKEVVVKWDAYREVVGTSTLLPNGGFEDGDDGTWDKVGPGWSIGTGPDYRTETGSYSARFADVKTKGSDILAPYIPAKVNDYIRASARIQQGDSSGSACGARVWMRYYDANGTEVGNHPGNLITTDRGGSWETSTTEGGAPAGTASVLVYVAAYRNKENKPLWVDNVTWDHKYSLGQNGDDTYSLSIEVTDSINRVAFWSGEITTVLNTLTSQLYPLEMWEGIGVSALASNMRVFDPTAAAPNEALSIAVTASGFKIQVAELPTNKSEGVSLAVLANSFAISQPVPKLYTGTEAITLSTTASGFVVKNNPVVMPTPEGVSVAATITGFTIQ